MNGLKSGGRRKLGNVAKGKRGYSPCDSDVCQTLEGGILQVLGGGDVIPP
jgi:hypothetical protein